MRNFAFSAVTALLVLGCASTPQQTQTIYPPGGEPVDPEAQASAYVESMIRGSLKDPDSLQYRFIPDTFGMQSCSSTYHTKIYRTWAIGVEVNARNSLGGYVGFKPYLIYFADGEPIAHHAIITGPRQYCPRGLMR